MMHTPVEIIDSGATAPKAISTAFHLLYHQLAWSYDLVAAAVSLGQWREWGKAALPFLHGVDVLELGHGPGHLQWELRLSGKRAVGVDASPQMGRLAQQNLRTRSKGWTEIVRARAQALPFPDASFDSVVSTFPAPYIVAPETLDEAGRVLRPGGRLVIVPEAVLTGDGPLVGAIDALYRLTGQRAPEPAAEPSARPGRVENALAAAGLPAEVHTVTLARSRVTVLVAEKRG
jgi:ubiquinone/menaquinone biosynthesis C-methylase UbiE